MSTKKRIDSIKDCCGCRACSEICPTNAISMEINCESFCYPKIDENKCINCSICYKVCPSTFSDFIPSKHFEVCIAVSKDGNIVDASSSGGMFSIMCEHYLKKGYIVWGVKFDDKLKVIHDFTSSTHDYHYFRKAKYVQSNTNGCFNKICSQLKEGNKVLFSGVPCQVAALKNFLHIKNINSENLVTVSLLCHGVPSQKMFDSHLEYLSRKYKSNVISYTFRNKETINNEKYSRTCKIVFENGKVLLLKPSEDAFIKGYYERLFLRPSCGNCKFAKNDRISDYTLADAWNIEKVYPSLKPSEGVSLVLANSKTVHDSFCIIKGKMNVYDISLEWALNSQDTFKNPTIFHKNRSLFFDLWSRIGFERAVLKSTKRSLFTRIHSFARRLIKFR